MLPWWPLLELLSWKPHGRAVAQAMAVRRHGLFLIFTRGKFPNESPGKPRIGTSILRMTHPTACISQNKASVLPRSHEQNLSLFYIQVQASSSSTHAPFPYLPFFSKCIIQCCAAITVSCRTNIHKRPPIARPSFVDPPYDWYSASVPVIICVISHQG